MDSAFWMEAVRQVPALAVVCVGGLFMISWVLRSVKTSADRLAAVVDQFLAYIEDRDSRLQHSEDSRTKRDEAREVAEQRREEQRNEALRRLGDTCHEFQEKLAHQADVRADRVAAVVEKNTDAIGKNTHLLGRVETVLEDIDRQLPKLKPT